MGQLRSRVSATLTGFVMVLAAGRAAGQVALDSDLEPYLARYQLPALAAAVVKNGEVIAAGAVGTRRAGTKLALTVNDRFHIGSDTKAMTALLAAMLVEEGKLRWDSTFAEVFPDLAKTADSGLQRVTVEQLLSHSSGMRGDDQTFLNLIEKAQLRDGNLNELRAWMVQEWSRFPLESKPGTKFAYSNMGYTIVGAMIERIAGKTWDEVIIERVFQPLDLRTAGLGCQSTLGKVDAPLGHRLINGKPTALLAGPDGDNPLVIGPAGIAHMSVLDFARWAGWNAGEGKREPRLVRAETMRKLHTPVISFGERKGAAPGTPRSGKYALGWGEALVDWAPEPLLHHAGSNQRSLAHVWVDPRRDWALVIVTNISNKQADEGLFALAPALHARFGKPK